MKIAHSTWVRYHHIDLARELERRGALVGVFTCLPWWRARMESRTQHIPRHKIHCNFLVQGIRRLAQRLPAIGARADSALAVLDTRVFSRWVAARLPPCDAYIGLSGTGLHAGRRAQAAGAGYVMDRGSTHIRHADQLLAEEYARWKLPRVPVNPWLIDNEIAESQAANLIIVPSHFAAETFVQQGIAREKLRVVPYGIQLKEFFSVAQPPADRFRLVFVGQFSLRKGALYLLQAFNEFAHPGKELVVVGNVSDDLKPLIAPYLNDRIRFVGAVPRSEVKTHLSSAHALVLPSIEEGLALVQAQAMACGCPIIATPNTGSETLFQHRREGLIVAPRSVPALVAAFTKLADDPALQRRLAAAALACARNIGGWERYADNVINFCREAQTLVAGGAAAAAATA